MIHTVEKVNNCEIPEERWEGKMCHTVLGIFHQIYLPTGKGHQLNIL